ncbi:gliding motility-associated-like protein, partial [Flavobacterium cutihirudinis]
PSVAASGLISGMALGTPYTVTAGNTDCTSASSASFSNAAKLATPAVPTIASTAPTCSADGFSTISNYVSGLTYTFDPTGPSVDTSGLISGMALGTPYTVTAGNTDCTSVASASFSNAAKLATPAVPTIAAVNQLTCSVNTGSFTISNFNNSYTYNITPAGATIDALTGIVTAPVGTYNVTATLNNCTSGILTVVIDSKICANADDFGTKISGATPLSLGDVTSNDKLNGLAVTTSNTNVTPKTTGPLSVDGDGILTLAANTASGTYSIIYQICEEGSASVNCDTATATVKVANVLVAKNDDFGTQPTGSTAVVIGDVTSNDELNGSPVTTTNTNVTPKTTGPLSVDADGKITLAGNTPGGTYSITYEICEDAANPANCQTAKATVKVANVLVAKNDDFGTQPTGSTAVVIGDVTSNDELNGSPVTTANTNVTPKTTGPLSVDADGKITLAGNTPGGTYSITYDICEDAANPANCKTATATVKVANVLVAKADDFGTQPTGSTAVVIGDVTSNDELNGSPVTTANTNVTPKTTGPLSVDADGKITLAGNTPSGTYSITYEICEDAANPANCQTATSTVKVANVLVAKADDFGTQPTGSTAVVIGDVTSNDELNGLPVTTTNTNVTPKTTGPLSVDADGKITLAGNTPGGTYSITYEICEDAANPANCQTATSTVKVANVLVANADDFGTQPTGSTAVVIGDVTSNDELNGSPVTTTNTNVTPKTTGPLSVDADGKITLAGNTPGGTYSITYEICEDAASPANCQTATATVKVANVLVANADDFGTQPTGSTAVVIGDVTSNDELNGSPVTTTNTNVTPKTTGPISVDADGKITLAGNTPGGTYSITYEICEDAASPANCQTATATVKVANVLVAKADDFGTQPTGSTAVVIGDVTSNDELNGSPVTPANTNVTPKTTGPLSVDADGKITLAGNTPGGTYSITYEICEDAASPANCQTATSTVKVANVLVANADDFGTQPTGSTAVVIGDVTSNDELNGSQVTTANTNVTPKTTGPLSVDADGKITLAGNTPGGTYSITYEICEDAASPANCQTATATVKVANVLVANDDTTYSVQVPDSSVAITVGNVTANDTLNNVAVTGTNTDVTPITTGPLSIDANGVLTLAPNTVSGIYKITYQLCEAGVTPTNCDTAEAIVEVKRPIVALVDTILPVNGNTGGTTISLTTNDTLNGNPVKIGTNPGEVSINIIGTLPTGITLNADGTITVSPGTPKGDYNVEYTICEIGSNPLNCDSVITVIKVTEGDLVANEDIVTSAVGINIPQNVINVFTNDTKNGLPLNPSDVKLDVLKEDPTGHLTLNPDGSVTLAPNTPAGDYELTYTICEILNQSNCKSNIVKVTVTAPKMTVTANSYCSNNVPYVSYNVTADNFTPNNLLTVRWIDSANNVVATQTDLPLSGDLLWPGAIVDSNGVGVDWPGWLLVNNQWIEGADGFENTRTGVTVEFSLNPTVNYAVSYPPATPQCNARPTFVIEANDDSAGPIDAKKNTSTSLNIFNNDKYNGTAIIPANIVLSTIVSNPNLILNADGSVDVKTGTPSGEYKLTYQICDGPGSSNCSQAVVTITVVNSVDPEPPVPTPLIAKDDEEISVDGINGMIEFINVLDNDSLGGLPINPDDIIIKNIPQSPYFEFNSNGTVNVKPNTPGASYTLVYQICQKSNPDNCTTAILKVFVEVPAIAIVKTAVFNDENKNRAANAGETITYSFTVTNTGNVPLKGVTISDPLPGVVVSGAPIDLEVNESNSSNFVAHYTIKQSDINLGLVTNQASVKGSSARGVDVEDMSDDSGVDGDKPTVIELKGCEIKVFNAFSPNGDAKNARFYIQGIECYPNNTVEIYNRWGVLVFDTEGYNNEDRVFVGRSEGRVTVKQTDGLPVGTYFYILKYKDSDSNQHESSGYLYLNK